ncbi:MAG: sigma-70 family RNA polymerase sigma factor [Bryobacterales bacterium]|nr:sigma-70 family RNA polymerase sigma factor [Bryobacterales bacterium]
MNFYYRITSQLFGVTRFAILRCSLDAKDVAQEAFVRLIQMMNRGAEPSNALPWLLRVAHNLAVTRVSRRKPEYPLDDGGLEQLPDVALNPEESVLAKQQLLVARKALDRLSSQELRCWTLRAEGLRYREIAEVWVSRRGPLPHFLYARRTSSPQLARRAGGSGANRMGSIA